MTTFIPNLRPLLVLAAGFLFIGADCEPDTLPGDTGSGPIIGAEAGNWTWVDVAGAVCADGSPTGLGVNPGTSDVLFVYLQGGGGCWDNETCVQTPQAINLDGFGLDEFSAQQLTLGAGPFARGDVANPLRDAHMVFVPYCTGDAHVGDAVADHDGVTMHHKGFVNMTQHLARIQATFPNVNKVVLAGSSAGGIGAIFNGPRVQQAYGDTPVHLISDTGIILPQPYNPKELEDAYRAAWNLDATTPAGCDGCATQLANIYSHVATTNPRVGLITKSHDSISLLSLGLTPAEYEAGLAALAPMIDAAPNAHYFVDAGLGHEQLDGGWHNTTASGVSLSQWVGQLISDDPAWTSVTD